MWRFNPEKPNVTEKTFNLKQISILARQNVSTLIKIKRFTELNLTDKLFRFLLTSAGEAHDFRKSCPKPLLLRNENLTKTTSYISIY